MLKQFTSLSYTYSLTFPLFPNHFYILGLFPVFERAATLTAVDELAA